MKKILLFLFAFLFLFIASFAFAHQPRIIWQQTGDVNINDPELSQAFYDELTGSPRIYFINSDKNFSLYLNILVPAGENGQGKYSANVFLVNGDKEENIAFLDGSKFEWKQMYEEFGRDWYVQGPEFKKDVTAGKYKIQVFSSNNTENKGKYVLAVGEKELFDAQSVFNVYWQIPLLKIQFFKSDILQFFLTPFGIGLIAVVGILLVLVALIYYIAGVIKMAIMHAQAKTLLLTSNGMQMKKEIVKLLQKPAYDITVAFISTAAKPLEDLEYLKNDWIIMRDELGFNVEEYDIEGKTEQQVMEALKLKDIIFVEGGNAHYLLNVMRKCRFERVIKKLLKNGKVYIGVSAGSIVAGKTIKTAEWGEQEEKFNVRDLKGLGLVPFDIFVHYKPEDAELIRKKLPWKWQRKKLKIVTDQQAILVQGKEVDLIGEGEAAII